MCDCYSGTTFGVIFITEPKMVVERLDYDFSYNVAQIHANYFIFTCMALVFLAFCLAVIFWIRKRNSKEVINNQN